MAYCLTDVARHVIQWILNPCFLFFKWHPMIQVCSLPNRCKTEHIGDAWRRAIPVSPYHGEGADADVERDVQHAYSWLGPDGYRSPRHRMPFESSKEGSKSVSMTWRAKGLADIASHVIGCHLPHETKVQNAFDDEAGNIRQALSRA